MRTIKEILGEDSMTDFLLKIQISFKAFCERVLGDMFSDGGLKDYMYEWFVLAQNNPFVGVLAPSGFGKTTVLGIAYPLWLAFTNWKKEILIVSKSLPQSVRILGLIRIAIENNELLLDLKPKNSAEAWSKQILTLSTNCRIYCRPYSENIKGERVDYEIFDEVDSYDRPDIFFDYMIPRLNPNGKIVLITTPEPGNTLMFKLKNKPEFILKSYPALVNIKNGDLSTGQSIWPERFPTNKLMEIRTLQGEEFFEKNFMVNPSAESEKALFSKKAILNCMDYSLGFSTQIDGRAFMGCDFAGSRGKEADYDAYIAVDKYLNHFIIKTVYMRKGTLTPVKVDKMDEMNKTYQFVKIRADISNIGQQIIPEMRARALPVVAQVFSSPERRELLNILRNVIDSGLLVIPANKDDKEAVKYSGLIFEQLIGFVEGESSKTGATLYLSKAAHDDLVMALAMAVREAVKQRDTKVFSATKEQPRTGFGTSLQR